MITAALVASEKVADHVAANILALEYLGGVPTVLVPDNLKSAVISRRGGVVRLNEVYKAFLNHYDTGATPARPRSPQDKAAVENAVKLIQRSLRRWLIGRPTPTITDLRQALAEIVDEWNARPMRRANGHSRRTLFEQEEMQHLQPLPRDRFECFEAVRKCRIGKHYHVQFKGSYYSVPHSLIGKTAMPRASSTTMRIFVDGLQVAIHPRLETVGAASTSREHLTKEQAGYTSVDLVEWALHYSQPVGILAAAEMERSVKAQTRARRSRWIKDLPRIHSRQRFITACERAVALGDLRFEHVENVLKRGIEHSTAEDPVRQTIRPGHNVRSPFDFSNGGEDCNGA